MVPEARDTSEEGGPSAGESIARDGGEAILRPAQRSRRRLYRWMFALVALALAALAFVVGVYVYGLEAARTEVGDALRLIGARAGSPLQVGRLEVGPDRVLLTDVDLTTADGGRVRVAEARVEFDFRELLRGRWRPRRVALRGARIDVPLVPSPGGALADLAEGLLGIGGPREASDAMPSTLPTIALHDADLALHGPDGAIAVQIAVERGVLRRAGADAPRGVLALEASGRVVDGPADLPRTAWSLRADVDRREERWSLALAFDAAVPAPTGIVPAGLPVADVTLHGLELASEGRLTLRGLRLSLGGPSGPAASADLLELRTDERLPALSGVGDALAVSPALHVELRRAVLPLPANGGRLRLDALSLDLAPLPLPEAVTERAESCEDAFGPDEGDAVSPCTPPPRRLREAFRAPVVRLVGELALGGVTLRGPVGERRLDDDLALAGPFEIEWHRRADRVLFSAAPAVRDRAFGTLEVALRELGGTPSLAWRARFPRQPCDDLLAAVPPDLLPHIADAALEGTATLDASGVRDLVPGAAARFTIGGDWTDCTMATAGRTVDPTLLDRPFVQRAFEDGAPTAAQVGPGTPGYVPLDQIPAHVQATVLSLNDLEFFYHPEFRSSSPLGALWLDPDLGRPAEGGAPIAQQLAWSLLLPQVPADQRGIVEGIVLARQVEHGASRERLLELFLNTARFGEGVFGITAAAAAYFGVHPAALTPLEGAFLATCSRWPVECQVLYRTRALPAEWRDRLKEILRAAWKDQRALTGRQFRLAAPYVPIFHYEGTGYLRPSVPAAEPRSERPIARREGAEREASPAP